MRTLKHTSKLALLFFMVAGLSLFTIGCSEDSPNGPGSAPMDNITVTLTRIGVIYDCDNNISFVDDAAGDFFYMFYVQTRDAEGGWQTVKSFPEKEIKIHNSETGEIPARSVSFSLPRENGQQFRVYTSVREEDSGGSNDFSSAKTFTHAFTEGQSQLWGPTDQAYSNFNTTTNNGYITRDINVREQSYFLGIVSVEGCKLNVRYDVDIRPAS